MYRLQMHVSQEDFTQLGYDLTGRGKRAELLGPTLLSQRLASEIKLSLSTKEVKNLTIKKTISAEEGDSH